MMGFLFDPGVIQWVALLLLAGFWIRSVSMPSARCLRVIFVPLTARVLRGMTDEEVLGW